MDMSNLINISFFQLEEFPFRGGNGLGLYVRDTPVEVTLSTILPERYSIPFHVFSPIFSSVCVDIRPRIFT